MRIIPPFPDEVRFSKMFMIALVAAAVLAAAIVVLNVVRPGADRGPLEASCGPLHWSPWDLPVAVYVDESAADWIPAVRRAASMWDAAAGRAVFDVRKGTPAVYGFFRRALAGGRDEPSGTAIVVSGATELPLQDDGDGHAKVRFDPATCRIGWAAVRLPDGEELPETVRTAAAAHELGHVLGFTHDPDPRSVMHETARSGQKILDGDAAHARTSLRL